jgi:hypothetical protein
MIQYPNGQLARKHKCGKTGKNEARNRTENMERIINVNLN